MCVSGACVCVSEWGVWVCERVGRGCVCGGGVWVGGGGGGGGGGVGLTWTFPLVLAKETLIYFQ